MNFAIIRMCAWPAIRLRSAKQKAILRMASIAALGEFLCRRWRHGSLRCLVDEFLHHIGPHYLLAYGAFFYRAALGKHSQQGFHLEYAQDGRICVAHIVSVDEVLLDLAGDGAVAERILLQRLYRCQERGQVFKRVAPPLHVREVTEPYTIFRDLHVER